jgi:CheY-like chemotaxis protein
MHDSNKNQRSKLQATRTSQQTVLNVESDSANALLIESLIGRRSDLQLITALNGHKGSEIAGSHQPDVVLMDTDLPDLSGLNFLKILRENPLTNHILVIALSSSAYRQQVDAGLRAGCCRYLTKSYKLDELMDAIDAALRCGAETRPRR